MREAGAPETESTIEMRFGRDLSWQRLTIMTSALGFPIVFLLLIQSGLQLAGALVWVGYLAAGLIFAIIAFSLGQIASRREAHSSGLYGLVLDVRDSYVPFLVGWLLTFGCIALAGLAAQAFATYVLPLTESTWPATRVSQMIVGGLALVLATLGNVLGTRRSRQLQSVMGGALIILLFVAFARSLPDWRFSHLSGGALLSAGSAIRWLATLAPGLIGLELALQARNEVRQPQKGLLRTLLVATAVTFGLSALLVFAATAMLGAPALAAGPLPPAAFVAAALGPVAGSVMQLISSLLLLITISTVLLLTSRQVHALARDGFLPHLTLETTLPVGRIRLWPIAIGLAVLGATFCPATYLAPIAGGGLLSAMAVVCLHRALVQDNAHERPHPFQRFTPTLAATVLVLLLAVTEPVGLVAGGIWIGLGIGIYLGYGKKGHIDAQQGTQVFRPRDEDADSRRDYSILVPVIGGGVSRLQMQLAASLARSQEGEVVPLRIVILPEQMTRAEGQRLAREESQLFSWSIPKEEDEHIQYRPITRLGRDIAQGILDTAREEDSDLILLGWRGQVSEEGESRLGQVVDEVVRNAPCDVAVVKGREAETLERILVPTAGGPHAPLAARIGLQLAEDFDARVTMLYVVPRGHAEANHALAQERIDATIAGLPHTEHAEVHIIESEGDIVESILAETRRGYDLTLLGASNMGLVDRLIFGSVPERIARDAETSVVMTKRFGGPARYWSYRVWRAVDRLFPDLSGEEQVAVYRRLRSDARPGINYSILILLSSIIATLGLLQNSAAVIIGAMLVAPLMSPILAVSMAIVRADFRLLTLALETALKGIIMAVIIAILLTWIVPGDVSGSEILARTRPTILDMIVALASGAAGAYALGRKEVAAALPGVAIAAALVPPLAVVGIGIASGNGTVAGGAMLLFFTNLIAISVAGAVIFLLLGIRPRRERDHRLRHGLAISFLLLALISIPLVIILTNSVNDTHQKSLAGEVVEQHLEAWNGAASLVEMGFDRTRNQTTLDLTIQCNETVDEARIAQLGRAIQQRLGNHVQMRVTIVPVSQFDLEFH